MRVSVIGIDPGAKGAVALLCNDPKTVLYWKLEELSWEEFCNLLEFNDVKHIYLEKAQAMPGQGSVSMFNYGMGFGRLLGWIDCHAIPYTLVTPRQWTKEIHQGCTGKDAKAKSLQAVKRLFPKENLVPKGCRVPHLGYVDALLIAEYGRRIFR